MFSKIFKGAPKGNKNAAGKHIMSGGKGGEAGGGGEGKPKRTLADIHPQLPGFTKPFKGPAFTGGGIHHTPVDADGKPTGMAQPYPVKSSRGGGSAGEYRSAGAKTRSSQYKTLDEHAAARVTEIGKLEKQGFKRTNAKDGVENFAHADGRTASIESTSTSRSGYDLNVKINTKKNETSAFAGAMRMSAQ